MKHNKGSIYYDKQRKQYRAMQVDPNGRKINKRFNTREEAESWLAEARTDIFKGTYIIPSEITFGEWLLEYLTLFVRDNVREKTFSDYLRILSHSAGIAERPLQKITTMEMQHYLYNLKVSASMKARLKALFKRASRKAVALGYIKTDFMLEVTTPAQKRTDIEIFTVEEITAVLKASQELPQFQKYYPIIYTAILTGMRMGEILALRIEDIEDSAINVKRSVSEVNGIPKITEPKTLAGKRRITVPKSLIALLKGLSATNGFNDGYIFHDANGNLPRGTSVSNAWRRLIKKLNISHRKFHCLRHTHATQLLVAGVPLLEVSKRLGHSRPAHTLNWYGHFVPGFDNNLPSQIEQIFLSNCPNLARFDKRIAPI